MEQEVTRGPLGLGDEGEEQKGGQLPGVLPGDQGRTGAGKRWEPHLDSEGTSPTSPPTAREDTSITHPGHGTHDGIFVTQALSAPGCLLPVGFHSKGRKQHAAATAQAHMGRLPAPW